MFDPSQWTLGQVSSAARDFAVVTFLFGLAWKARGIFEIAKKFFERVTKHMDVMETGMQTLLTNHLTHIEADLRTVVSRQVRGTDEAEYIEEEPDQR